MIKKLILAVLVTAISVTSYADSIEPEKVSRITVSNIEVNRVVCPYPIREVKYSEETGVKYSASGNNLFIKFPITISELDGKEVSRTLFSGNTELFLVCDEKVYSLIMQPKKVSAQTIYLSDTAGEMKKAHNYVSQNDYESLMLDLIQAMIDVRTPPGFVMNDVNLSENYRNIRFNTVKTLTGGGYIVKEVILRSDRMVSIADTEFMKVRGFKNVKAVAIMDSSFVGVTKAYVIEGVIK
ncbi:hypothetical protein ADMFC3_00320 [Geovibrio sp. ADMFC3]